MLFVYTSRLNNTDRFVRRVADQIHPRPLMLRLPWNPSGAEVQKAIDYAGKIDDDIIIFSPSYRQTRTSEIGTEYTPPSIVSFLNEENCAITSRVKAVVGTGNLTFGHEFCLSGKELSKLLSVPLLAKVDMSGTSADDMTIISFCQSQIPEELLK